MKDMDEMNSANARVSKEAIRDSVATFTRFADVTKVRHARHSTFSMQDVIIAPIIASLNEQPAEGAIIQRTTADDMSDSDTHAPVDRVHDEFRARPPSPEIRKRKKRRVDDDDEVAEDSGEDEPVSISSLTAKLAKLTKKYEKTKLSRYHYKSEYHIALLAHRRHISAQSLPANNNIAQHRITAWVHSPQRLDSEDQGEYAQVGVGIFVRDVHPASLNNSSPEEIGEMKVHPSLCIWKLSYVLEANMDPFTYEAEVLMTIQQYPSPYLPIVYGAAGMLQSIPPMEAAKRRRKNKKNDTDMLNDARKAEQQVVMCGATEYLRGMPFDSWLMDQLERARLAKMSADDRQTDRLKISLQLVRGVSHLHKIGVVHRDIKANNVMIMSPSIYSLVASRGDFRLKTNAPYPGDIASSFAQPAGYFASPSSSEARRSLHADGYAQSFAFDKVDLHPTVGDDVSSYRVCIIDYNTSAMIAPVAASMTILKAEQYNVGVQEYMKQPTKYNSDEQAILGDWKNLSIDSNTIESRMAYWNHYDHHPLAMVILDVFRGVGFDFDQDRREEMLARYRTMYLEYCRVSLDLNKLPSMYEFMRDKLRDASMFAHDDFITRNRASYEALKQLPALSELLHRATASSWTNQATKQTVGVIIPSLATIETTLEEALACRSVVEKMTAYNIDVVAVPTDGDCAFHSFKQQADLLRSNSEGPLFSDELTRMLDGSSLSSSSETAAASSSSSSPSSSDSYVRRLRDGLVHWLTMRLVRGDSEIMGQLYVLNTREPPSANIDAPSLPPPIIEASDAASDAASDTGDVEVLPQAEDERYAIDKRRVEKVTKINIMGEWDNLSGDRVVEMLAQMFDVTIRIIFAKSGNQHLDIIVNRIELTKGRPIMNFYRTINHYKGTKPRN